MIDARRMEVFTCLFTITGKEAESVSAKIIGPETYIELLSSERIVFFGSGMDKCRDVLSHPNASFINDVYPHADSLAVLSEETYQKKMFEDLAYFEPFYLKDFIATIPKRNLPV
jgi:tRNA threonylcarbamoyladenosine biosynthesis protein TsaB